MAKKFEEQDGPYEFERPISSGSKFKSAAYGVAGFAVAAVLLTGTAYAVNAAPETSNPSVVVSDQTQPLGEITAETDDSNDASVTEPETHHSREISTPVDVLKPNFVSGDDDEDDADDQDEDLDDDGDHHGDHHEDSAFESEDSEDD